MTQPTEVGKELFAILKARAEARSKGERPKESLNLHLEQSQAEEARRKEEAKKNGRPIFDLLHLKVDPWVHYQVVYFMGRFECQCCGNKWEAPSFQGPGGPEPFLRDVHTQDKTKFRYRPLRGFSYQMYKSLPKIVLLEPLTKVWVCPLCFVTTDLYLGSAEKLQNEQAEFELGLETLNHMSPNEPGQALLEYKGSGEPNG